MIRNALPKDIPALIDLSVESVVENSIGDIVQPDPESIRNTAKALMANKHYLRVSETNGEIVAAVAAAVQPGMWFKRNQCSVLMYRTRRPGHGLMLLRDFARWVRSRPAIKVAVFELEENVDPRLIQFLDRVGFTRQTTNMAFVRGIPSCQAL